MQRAISFFCVSAGVRVEAFTVVWRYASGRVCGTPARQFGVTAVVEVRWLHLISLREKMPLSGPSPGGLAFCCLDDHFRIDGARAKPLPVYRAYSSSPRSDSQSRTWRILVPTLPATVPRSPPHSSVRELGAEQQ